MHLRQVLDIDVDEAGFVVLEGFLRRRRTIVLFDQFAHVRHPMTATATQRLRPAQ